MAKTQMQYANRAWRKNTRALGWSAGWPGGNSKKQWKAFCRENARVIVEDSGDVFNCQDEADDSVSTELSYWD